MTMTLSPEIEDRAAGVLLGQAIGDALGVPYEFAAPVAPGRARMVGGGLGPYAPGEWSDDTQMAVCVARVSARGADLTRAEGLDEVAAAFLEWARRGATDIGALTAAVLRGSPSGDEGVPGLSERLTERAVELSRGGNAGNGGLMRTAIVGVSALDSADRTALAARAVCALTHAEPRCVDASVLWSLAVRHAVLTGELDLAVGLPWVEAGEPRGFWERTLEAALAGDPSRFTPNGYTVTALQAAASAIWSTRPRARASVEGRTAGSTGPARIGAATPARSAATAHVRAALQRAVAIGDDTDTVAAIAGGLLGACYGASALPPEWVEQVHGWPGDLRAGDLRRLALDTARAGVGRGGAA